MRRILLASVITILAAAPALAGSLEPGVEAPSFSLTDQAGNTVSLNDFDGKIRVLEWINPDCPFVQRHYRAGTMKTLASEYAEHGVVWMAINSTHYFNQQKNAEFHKQHELPYPVLDDANGSVGSAYDAATTPQMVIIDGDGTVVYNGAIDDDPRGKKDDDVNYVRAALDQLLNGQSIATATTQPYGCSVKYAKK